MGKKWDIPLLFLPFNEIQRSVILEVNAASENLDVKFGLVLSSCEHLDLSD